MRILITTGLSKSDIGGPFQYASNLATEFRNVGHEVKIVSYGAVEKFLPPWIRHIYFLLKICRWVWWSNWVMSLDTYSVGIPSVLVARLLRKKILIRVGGDFLWSAYVNRTGAAVTLPAFYHEMPRLNLKERIILFVTKIFINKVNYLAFNTQWQKNLWQNFYNIQSGKSGVVRNFIPRKRTGHISSVKNLLWAGRLIPEKNIERLKRAGERVAQGHPEFRLDIVTGESHEKIIERLKNCYAVISVAFTDISPNFIIEAVSFNKPFILTKETGLIEIFPSGNILVDPCDVEEIVKAIESILNEKEYNKHVEALKKIELNHGWTELAVEFIEIWKKI